MVQVFPLKYPNHWKGSLILMYCGVDGYVIHCEAREVRMCFIKLSWNPALLLDTKGWGGLVAFG